MNRSDILAALEERLFFYRDLMLRFPKAAADEDVERINQYTELETQEGKKILALEKSLKSFPSGIGEAENEKERLLEARIAAAAKEARVASETARRVLLERLEDLRRRAAEAKRSSQGKGSSPLPPPPSFIDISL